MNSVSAGHIDSASSTDSSALIENSAAALLKWTIARNAGTVSTSANSHGTSSTRLRPWRSDSAPETTANSALVSPATTVAPNAMSTFM